MRRWVMRSLVLGDKMGGMDGGGEWRWDLGEK
jgi:hypothetical protein